MDKEVAEFQAQVSFGLDKAQTEVAMFTHLTGHLTPVKPFIPSIEVRKLRVKLIAEELMELCKAYNVGLGIDTADDLLEVSSSENIHLTGQVDLVEAYDATLDLLYVVIGNGVAMGTRLETGWNEVHRSNMSKFIDGKRNEDGKWVKGPLYSPANLKTILDAQ